MFRHFRKWRDDQTGTTMVLVSIAMVALLGLGAISVDAGHIYAERARLSDIADAAALAGAQSLPDHEFAAIETALQYVELNGIDRANAEAVIVGSAKRRVQVTIHGEVDLTFARALHLYETSLLVESTAVKGPLGAVTGAIPLGVDLPAGIVFGQECILKDGGGSGSNGNYGALALGGRGASTYSLNLQYGYSGSLSIGQAIDTEPGNKAGPTQRAIEARLALDPDATIDTVLPDSPRLVVVPIVSFADVNGRGQVTIKGFAAFFLEEMVSKAEVRGQFVRMFMTGQINEDETAPDYGLAVVKLTR